MHEPQNTASRILTGLDEIDAVAEAWRDLEHKCADPLAYFQSHDWCRKWAAQFATDGKTIPHIQTLWRGETLLAVWPLMVVEAAGIRRLETLGVPHSQYCGMLVREGQVRRDELARLLDDTVAQSGCDVAVLRTVPEAGWLAEAAGGLPMVADTDNVASMLDLSAFSSSDDYVAQLGKLQKRNRNRRRNHLARRGELDFSVIWPGHPDFAPLVRRAAAMKREWLAETGRFSAGFSMTGYEDFLSTLGGDAESMAGAVLFVLRAGDDVVALELGFLRQGHYYAYIGGFDWSLRALSPGKVQMEMTVCWLIDNGVTTYDLLANPADYKASWSSRSISVGAHARALTWKGKLYVSTWLPTVRPALKKLSGRLPDLMQKAMMMLRGAACLLLYV